MIVKIKILDKQLYLLFSVRDRESKLGRKVFNIICHDHYILTILWYYVSQTFALMIFSVLA